MNECKNVFEIIKFPLIKFNTLDLHTSNDLVKKVGTLISFRQNAFCMYIIFKLYLIRWCKPLTLRSTKRLFNIIIYNIGLFHYLLFSIFNVILIHVKL